LKQTSNDVAAESYLTLFKRNLIDYTTFYYFILLLKESNYFFSSMNVKALPFNYR